MTPHSEAYIGMSESDKARFWSYVNKTATCWIWIGNKSKGGYGRLGVGGRAGKMYMAHRLSFNIARGPIPEGLQLDHLCRNRACVNPDHLEPVTIKENLLRGFGWSGRNVKKTHCPAGHPYDDRNTYSWRPGYRRCRPCNAAARKRYKAARRSR